LRCEEGKRSEDLSSNLKATGGKKLD